MKVKFKKAYFEEKTIEMNSKIFVTDMPFKSIEDLEVARLQELELRQNSDFDEDFESLEFRFFNFYFLEVWESYPGNLCLSKKIHLCVYLNDLENNLDFSDIDINGGSFELDEILNKIENGKLRYMQKEEFDHILKMNIAQITSLLEKENL